MTDKDGICYYCGKMTSSIAGNPSEWPVMLCHRDEPGKVKHHHTGCVMDRLICLEQIRELIKEEWRPHFEERDGEVSAYADRGDFNCPHRKEYDPSDGHGVSQVWAGDIEGRLERNENIKTLEEAIHLLYEKCKKVVPGQLWEIKK